MKNKTLHIFEPNLDVHLNYAGGSGGFLALHLLLLSKHYSNELNDRLDTVISRQWNIIDHSKWKHNEAWPDNNKTLSQPGSPKLFFYCHLPVPTWEQLYGIKLLIYTDLATQIALCDYKKAGSVIPAIDRDLNIHFNKFYNNVKDPAWPDCTDINQSKILPEHIQHELLTHAAYIEFVAATSWVQWFVNTQQEHKIKNDIVFPEVATLAKHSDLTIKLQDILNTNGRALLDPLGLPVLEQHFALIEKWKSLHSNEILSIIDSSS
jgi:hypothetical protein